MLLFLLELSKCKPKVVTNLIAMGYFLARKLAHLKVFLSVGLAAIASLDGVSYPQLAVAQTNKTRPAGSSTRALVERHHGQHYPGCLFGDSISSGLGDSLGNQVANLALGGLTSESLITQLNLLQPAGITCSTAVIAIGTNDAMSGLADELFVANLFEIVALVQKMGAVQISVVPAFYSTLEASHDPHRAGTLSRIDEINALITQMAQSAPFFLANTGLEALFQGDSLRKELTYDGVHLNESGQAIYRQFLAKLFEVSKVQVTQSSFSKLER